MRDETYLQYFNRINEGIQSCMSYAGIREINDLSTMDFKYRFSN